MEGGGDNGIQVRRPRGSRAGKAGSDVVLGMVVEEGGGEVLARGRGERAVGR